MADLGTVNDVLGPDLEVLLVMEGMQNELKMCQWDTMIVGLFVLFQTILYAEAAIHSSNSGISSSMA